MERRFLSSDLIARLDLNLTAFGRYIRLGNIVFPQIFPAFFQHSV
jgi:hypothetical protein